MVLFWERGYDAVGIKDLTAALGISDSSLYAAFGNKAALFAEAVTEYAKRYGGYLDEAFTEPTAAQAVHRLLAAAVRQQTLPGRPHGCLIINGATNHHPQSAGIAENLRQRRDDVRRLIADKIQADIDAGTLPEHVEPRALARYVMAVWVGIAQLARDGAARNDLLQVADTALRAWPTAVSDS